MSVLVAGFAPFAGEPINPSWEAARRLEGRHIAGMRVAARRMPVSFAGCGPALEAALGETRARLIVLAGLAGGRAGLSLERVAINLIDARIPDEDGARPVDMPVLDGAPAAYFATIPIKAAAARARQAGIETHISHSAGTFVCNALFFQARHLAATAPGGVGVGLAHVPFLPAQAGARGPHVPFMELEAMVEGLAFVAETALTCARDLDVSEGAIA